MTYRKFDNLYKALLSVTKQTYSNLELIIQDDGSEFFPEDEIRSYLREQGTALQFIIHHNERNIGTVRSYNLAVQAAKGEIIVPLSQDDIFADPLVIETIVNRFSETGCLLCTAKRRGAVSGRVLPHCASADLLLKADKRKLLLAMMFNPIISGSVLYFRKEAFLTKDKTIFDERFLLVEDWPFLIKIIENDLRIEFIDKVCIEYGEAGVSSAHTPSPTFLEDVVHLYEIVILPLSESMYGKSIQSILQYKYRRYLDRYDSAQNGYKTNTHSRKYLLQNKRLWVLLPGMRIYEKMRRAESAVSRTEYMLLTESNL